MNISMFQDLKVAFYKLIGKTFVRQIIINYHVLKLLYVSANLLVKEVVYLYVVLIMKLLFEIVTSILIHVP